MIRTVGKIISVILFLSILSFFVYGITVTYPDSPYIIAMWILIAAVIVIIATFKIMTVSKHK